MIKVLMFVVAISLLCRWALGKWPWAYLMPAPTRSQTLFRARRLLSVSEKADHQEIRDAHRRLSAIPSPYGTGDAAERSVAAINAMLTAA